MTSFTSGQEEYRILFRYDAQEDDEISLKEGEVRHLKYYVEPMLLLLQYVRVLSKEVGDDNWWRGEVGGVVGLFPHCFVEREKYKVLHNYQAQNSDEISLKKGQVTSFLFPRNIMKYQY